MLVAELINLGSLNISTNVFTDGSAMPTRTELNASNATASPIIAEITTALNATPGNVTVTYVDQDGNTAEATTAQALPVSGPIHDAGYIALNGQDWGARDITTATRTGGTTPTGTVKFWGLLPLALISSTPVAQQAVKANLLTGDFNLSRLGAGATIGVFSNSSATRAMLGDVYFIGDS
jgi:hypothetical protein